MSRRLVLVRHAKTVSAAASDAERPLTERGRRQASLLGTRLAEQRLGVTHALVSPAVRARETWSGVAAGLDGATHELVDDLYVATPDDVLSAVRTSGSVADTLVVVGHNPTIADLAWLLAGDVPGGAYDELRSGGYSPSTTTLFAAESEWEDVDQTSLGLIGYIPPLA